MSVISGLSKADIKTASDGLLELSEEKLRSIMRTEPITDVYHVEQTPFARGKFASVRKIRHLVSGEEYAAKFIRKRRRAADSSREIQHEVAVLALCAGCTRVVRLHEVYETRSEVAIVLELCAGGELQRLLDEEERLSEGAARRALRHVLEGLAHLHARRIAHLDLKPQNLLLTGGGEELLICDFGISRAIQPGAHVREILGTRDYVAPEILSYEPLSLAADMWSVGVLAYVLVSGYSPFAGETKQETYLNIAQCQLSFPRDLFRGVSQRAMQFIRDTLVVDPKGRLTVEECLEHPWLKDDTDIPRAIVGLGFDTAASDSDETENGVNGNGVNGHNGVNGVNGHSNGTNGTHDEEKERAVSPCAEERLPPLKHAHARDPAPPFPDAPSTPKVSRKSLPSPPSVLALCKKFQPDYEKPAARACPCECGACCPPAPAPCLRLRLPPARAAQDRALIC
ncbi:death-associated protein kinase related isoform X2 [Leguminivora glycinivorella]|uniref:death-associated protein kinase related isoform X2 n=1 Tax=Leguminivora glycinivorella TaxID=1035111 RepID=UPI00200DA2DF|nr:death-associated protein kinase related isoform X2 [Leguminivora glycinivorella]